MNPLDPHNVTSQQLRYEDTWIISCQKKTDMDILPMLASENWMQVPCQTATNSHTCIFIPPTQAHLFLPTAIGQSSNCLQPSRPRPSNGYQSYPKCSPKRCPNQCKILLALLPLRMAARPSKVIRQPHECVASFLEHRLRQNDTVYAMVFLKRCHTPRTLTHSQPRTVVPILSSIECITKHLEQHGQELKLISDTLLT